MKYKYLLISTIVLFFAGCEDKRPDEREFPIIRTYSPSDVNASGATFKGEIVQTCKTPISSYGFLWSYGEPDLSKPNKIILGEKSGTRSFEKRIDYALAKGMSYKIRAYATFGIKTVYGNLVTFTSRGSEKSSWSLEIDNIKSIGSYVYGPFATSAGDYGYLLFPSSSALIYDQVKNEFSIIPDFPVEGNSATRYSAVSDGNTQYFLSNINNNLYKLEAGIWSIKSTLPFNYAGFSKYYSGLAVSGNIYILSSYKSYMFNPNTNIWQPKAIIPNSISAGGTYLNDNAYVITTDKNIWEYNVSTDNWVIKTKFPGILIDKIISFSYENKIYFGLSYHDHYFDPAYYNGAAWMDRKLWSYDLLSNQWSALEDFPADLPPGVLFYFFLKDKFYVGSGYGTDYKLWKFDASKK